MVTFFLLQMNEIILNLKCLHCTGYVVRSIAIPPPPLWLFRGYAATMPRLCRGYAVELWVGACTKIAQALPNHMLLRKRRAVARVTPHEPIRAQPMSAQTDGDARSGSHRVDDSSHERRELLRARRNPGGAIWARGGRFGW